MMLHTESESVRLSITSPSDLLFGACPGALQQEDVEAVAFIEKWIMDAGAGRFAHAIPAKPHRNKSLPRGSTKQPPPWVRATAGVEACRLSR